MSIERIHYVPDFVTVEEERQLMERVYGVPKPKWRTLARRRLQNWGGTLAGSAETGKQFLLQDEQLPEWLEHCIDKIMALDSGSPLTNFPAENRPNHVLVNEYLPGQGIMPHTDGPAFYPLISTISLGSHTMLDFYDQDPSDSSRRTSVGSVLLERRSLVLIAGHAYQMLHGIEERNTDQIESVDALLNRSALSKSAIAMVDHGELDRQTRVSLTIRNVPITKRVPMMIKKCLDVRK
uniref:Fe2OG dioxygenase domain-containing protein n=1 Tax=Globodera pallida TaxID=36090 RepID=A0A183CF27_GLOPA